MSKTLTSTYAEPTQSHHQPDDFPHDGGLRFAVSDYRSSVSLPYRVGLQLTRGFMDQFELFRDSAILAADCSRPICKLRLSHDMEETQTLSVLALYNADIRISSKQYLLTLVCHTNKPHLDRERR